MRVGIPWPSSTTPSSDVGWFGSSFLNRMMVWRLLDIFLSGLGFSSKTHSHLTPSSSSLHSSSRFRSIGDAVNEFFALCFFQYRVTLSFHNLFAGRKTQNRRDKGSRLVHLNSFSIQANSKLHFKHRSLLRGLQKFTFLKGWCFKSRSRSS